VPEDRSVLTRPGPEPAATLRYGDDPDQVIDVYPVDPSVAADPSAPKHPTVVFVHGGYWRTDYDRRHARSAAAALRTAGFPTALIEYRRRPGDPDATIEDVAAGIRAAASGALGLPDGPVVVVGHSAGGHLALVAASDPDLPIAGCLALAPVADLRMAEDFALDVDGVGAFIGCSAIDRPDLDPCRLTCSTLTLVLHGEEDDLVPIALSESFTQTSGQRLIRMPGTGHFALIDPTSPVWPDVIAHLRAIAPVAGIE
jgi:acetyl esterase/lipase